MKLLKIFILLLFMSSTIVSVSAQNQTKNEIHYSNSLSGQSHVVSEDNIFYIDFSHMGNVVLFSLFIIILLISFIFVVHPINSLSLMFTSFILIANGFNIFISFILFLISIVLIVKSKNK